MRLINKMSNNIFGMLAVVVFGGFLINYHNINGINSVIALIITVILSIVAFEPNFKKEINE